MVKENKVRRPKGLGAAGQGIHLAHSRDWARESFAKTRPQDAEPGGESIPGNRPRTTRGLALAAMIAPLLGLLRRIKIL